MNTKEILPILFSLANLTSKMQKEERIQFWMYLLQIIDYELQKETNIISIN